MDASPRDDELRVGVGSFDPRDHVKEPTVRLAGDLGVPAERYQGNWIPHQMRARVEDGVFFVGDSAGHCLPTTAEGIRTALYFGLACGRELRAVVEGRQTREQALDALRRVLRGAPLGVHAGCCACSAGSAALNPLPGHDAARCELMDRQSFVDWSFGHYLEIAPPGFVVPGPPAALKNASAPTEHLGVVRSLPSLILRPAIAVLDRLRLAHKLVLIALVLIAPALYATWQFRSQQNAQIAFSSKERVGIEEIVPAGRLLTELANARALAVRSAGGDAEATARCPPRARPSRSRSPRSTPPTAAWAPQLGHRQDVEAAADVDPGDRRRAPDRRAQRSPPTTA